MFDPFGKLVKIVETVSGSVTSTKQFIWCDDDRCEERDGSGNVTKQFFSRGQRNGSTNYFYSTDHLGSIHAITDDSGVQQASYSFDPYGRTRKLDGGQESDFQFGGYYLHSRSGLNLTRTRAYSAVLARFISRDPIEEDGGINLYGYVRNDPIMFIDPLGLKLIVISKPAKNIIIKCCTLGTAQHIYLYSTESGTAAGMGKNRGVPAGWTFAQNKYPYTTVQPNPDGTYGTGGLTEAQVIESVQSSISSPLWLPGLNDCHSRLQKRLEELGIKWPGTPYGRFK